MLRDPFSPREILALKPTERIDIVDWMESRRSLGARSDESGRMRIDRTPYVEPWLRAAVDPDIEEVVVCASAQVAKTEFGITVAGYYADVEKAPVLYSLADEATARHVSRDRLRKMFEDSPELFHLIDSAPVVNNEEIELNNGGYLGIVWASSVAALGTRPFRITIADEVDKPGYYVKTSEAMPLSLIRERTESFHNFKHILFSTPTIEGGNITAELESCDVIYDWHVPCPECGVKQPLRFSPKHAHGFRHGFYRGADGKRYRLGGVAWEGGREATKGQTMGARYECGACGAHWTTAMKNRAVMLGEAVPRGPVPAIVRKVGFHVNRIYSLLGKSGNLDKLVDAFLAAVRTKNPRIIQGFINSTLAEPFRPNKRVRAVDVLERLKDDRPRGVVPGGDKIAVLLAGVDTQDDGFYFEIRAFGYGLTRESWCIREGFLTDFDSLAQVLWGDQYLDVHGNRYPVRMTCQDAMGHRTADVYDFCRMNRGRIWACQGAQTMATPYNFRGINRYPGTNKVIPGGVQLVRWDTNHYKSQLYNMMEVNPTDPGAWHYHSEITLDWLKQMTAESVGEKGFWENPLERPNHAWDCSALLLLAHDILGAAFISKPEPSSQAPEPEPVVVSGGWINRDRESGTGGSSWIRR
jgi:phage terminase large subunit GpA-like protein